MCPWLSAVLVPEMIAFLGLDELVTLGIFRAVYGTAATAGSYYQYQQ